MYSDLQIIMGNSQNILPEGHILDPPIIARCIRIRVKSWQSHIAMRLELYGCTEGDLKVKGDNSLYSFFFFYIQNHDYYHWSTKYLLPCSHFPPKKEQ